MQIREMISSNEARQFSTEQMRQAFLIENLMMADTISFCYSHYDRFITGGAVPLKQALKLETHDALRTAHFLDRREMGVLNIGGDGIVEVDSHSFSLASKQALYIGKGSKSIIFRSEKADDPAKFYLVSTPAHQPYPTQKCALEQADPTALGSDANCNNRTIYKMVHDGGIQSCQLVMGLTVLAEGSIWNTMPCHVHDRRMEVYFYFELAENARIVHLMGKPQETRHLVIQNEQAVISPPWSIHSGCGTSNYSFIWAMAGENKDFTDMDMVEMAELK